MYIRKDGVCAVKETKQTWKDKRSTNEYSHRMKQIALRRHQDALHKCLCDDTMMR